MSSQYTFQPYGISALVTVTVATSTVNLSTTLSGGTSTLTVTSGNFQANSIRVANLGAVGVSVLFSVTGTSAITLTSSNGMQMLQSSVESFRVAGLPVMQALSAGTTTLCITLGEGF